MENKFGSSGNLVPGIVEVVESELEVFHVSEAIGLALHGFDFVVETIQGTVGDFVRVLAE